MKIAIWIITLLGILPILFLSVTQVHLHLIKKNQLFSEGNIQEKPSFVWISFKPVIKAGPFKYQSLRLSHMVWPACVSILGIILVFIGLFFLIPKQVSVVESDGSKDLKGYVKKLLRSKATFTSLGVFTLDDQDGFSVWKKDGLVTVNLSAQLIPSDGTEEKIISFFEGLGIKPTSDYKFQNGDIKDSARSLSYPIKADVDEISEICMRIMTEIYNIKEKDGLKYHLDTP